MTEETTTEVTEVTEVQAPAEEVAAVDETAAVVSEEAIEKAVTISEVEDSLDFTKMISDLKTFFGESIKKNLDNSTASVGEIAKMVEETTASVTKAISDLSEKYEALNKTVTDMYGKIEYVDNKLNGFESATAVKKSSDLNGSLEETKIQKSIWQGHFLGVNSLTKNL